jgi:fructose-1-phosphate kinase PfkB-like protein
MVATLGAPTTFCGTFGGETGAVARMLVEREDVAVCAVGVAAQARPA